MSIVHITARTHGKHMNQCSGYSRNHIPHWSARSMKRNKQMKLFLSPQNDALRCCFTSKFNNFPSLASPLHARSDRYALARPFNPLNRACSYPDFRTPCPCCRGGFKYNRTITAFCSFCRSIISLIFHLPFSVAICIISLLLSFCNYYVMVVFLFLSHFSFSA